MERKCWMAVAAILAVLLFAPGGGARPAPRQRIIRLKVSVFNDAQIPTSVLTEAEARAQVVFEQAGVELTWLDCGTPGNWHQGLGCEEMAFPTHLSVRLVTSRKTGSDDIFGQSFLNQQGEGNYAKVYLTPLSSAKARELIPEGDLLGYVVVHEIGHLLLGKNSHSADGLMRAKWEVSELREAARGKLLFTSSESEQMRARFWSATARRDAVPANSNSSGK
jgi:hypothetical protein